MTIRRQLSLLVGTGSLLVAVAGTVGLSALFFAQRHVTAVQNDALPIIAYAGRMADNAENLSQLLGDFVDARYTGDQSQYREINRRIGEDFEAFDTANSVLQKEALRLGSNAENAIRQMRERSTELKRDWLTLQGISANGPQWQIALRFDDCASKLVHQALTTQASTIREMNSRLIDAKDDVGDVIDYSLIFGGTILGVTLGFGFYFSRRLAQRLEVIRLQAKCIASGDLSTNLPIAGDDEVDQIAAAFNDMTKALRSSRQQLEHDSLHDPLTGLPNRALFKERLERRLTEAKRYTDYSFAVLFLDLDHFKLVNDSFGHAAGDALLRTAAARLEHAVKEHGAVTGVMDTVARLGGDEFTLLLEQVKDLDDAIAVAKAVKSSLESIMQIEGNEITVSTSIGIALAGDHNSDAKALMSEADAALYRAKSNGRNGYAVFDASMREEAVQKMRMENDLRRGLEREEFVLHFQPIFDLVDGGLTGFEALIRWARGGELLAPDLFIPLAEETGQIVEIGEWVIAEACEQFQKWRTLYGGPNLLTINLSRRQLLDPNLLPHFKAVLAKTGVPATSLAVEIAESMLGDVETIAQTLVKIRALGILVYIDDFGTGYSTLNSLHRSAVDGIKIDKSFTKPGNVERSQLALLKTVVELAHHMNIPVVAEGIESIDQAAMYQAISCDGGQGFHLGRPLTSSDAERLLSMPPSKQLEVA